VGFEAVDGELDVLLTEWDMCAPCALPPVAFLTGFVVSESA